MNSTKDRFIETTCELLESQGYHATGLNQIVKESGAPKGSLYYHFPDGKEELAAEAVQRAGDLTSDLIRLNFQEDISLAEAVRQFILEVAKRVEESEYQSGGPLTATAMETATTNERLNLTCRESFAKIQAAFSDKIEKSGINPERAAELAAFITAALEGGIILSRTMHTGDPLRQVSQELYDYLKT